MFIVEEELSGNYEPSSGSYYMSGSVQKPSKKAADLISKYQFQEGEL